MNAAKSLLLTGILAITSSAYAREAIWSCEITGGESSLESVNIEMGKNGGLFGTVLFNHPFDNEGYYDVRVEARNSKGWIEYKGEQKDGGRFDLVLKVNDKPRSGDRARGTVSGKITAKADGTGFGADHYKDVPVDCVFQGK